MMCPNCNTEMEPDEVDMDDMTDGQQADYLAGFHGVWCPKCGNTADDWTSPM